MRIVVFGAGSLGSALAGLLARSHEVCVIGRSDNVQEIREHGLRMLGSVRAKAQVEAHTDLDDVAQPDLLIISTKAYDTRNAVRQCRPWLGPDAMVLTLQNGLGNIDVLRRWRRGKAFSGTTTMGACLESPGRVRISGLGGTQIGGDMDESGAHAIADAFARSGLRASVTKDITQAIWVKALVNSCINPLTALLRVQNGALLRSDSLMVLMKAICVEGETVARSAGVRIPRGLSYLRALEVAHDTAGNTSSMLRDILLGRRTEIGQINGEIARIGRKSGVQSPLNSLLVAMVEGLGESGSREKG